MLDCPKESSYYVSLKVALCECRYLESGEQYKLGYEERFLETLQSLVRRLDRRLDQCEQRLSTSAKAKEKVQECWCRWVGSVWWCKVTAVVVEVGDCGGAG